MLIKRIPYGKMAFEFVSQDLAVPGTIICIAKDATPILVGNVNCLLGECDCCDRSYDIVEWYSVSLIESVSEALKK